MCRYTGLLIMMAITCSCASAAGAYTVSFDEVPAGSNVQVYLNTDTPFLASSAFTVEDHSAASWGPPRSGSNVMVCGALLGYITLVAPPFDAAGWGRPINAAFFGGYFSTPLGVEVEMTLSKRVGQQLFAITSLTIGAQNEAWSNRYLSYASAAGDIYSIKFEELSLWTYPPTTPGLFSIDDMTITPVPEPSSLAALICGLVGAGGVVVRRKPSAERGGI